MKRSFLFLIFNLIFLQSFSQNSHKNLFESSCKLFDDNKLDESLKDINRAIEIDSTNRIYLLHKIRILFIKSECSEAFIALGKLIAYEKSLKDDTISYFCDLADCINEEDSATDILYEYVKKDLYVSNEILVRLAQRLFISKRYEESVFYYKKYLNKNPNDVDVIIDLSRILFAYKGIDESIAEIKRGLSTNQNSLDLLNCLVAYYYTSKNYENAIEIQSEIINIEYNLKNIETLALLHEQKGDLFDAYEDYKKIICLEKCHVKYYSKILQYEFDNKLFDNVVEHSLELINCNKNFEESVLDGLYTSLFFSDDFEKGKIYLDKRLSSKPDVFLPYYTKALILTDKKLYDRALEYIELALNCNDIKEDDISKIKLLKYGIYLVKKEYQYFENKNGKDLNFNSNINVSIIDDDIKNTFIKIEFNKEAGLINTSLSISANDIEILKNKYRFVID